MVLEDVLTLGKIFFKERYYLENIGFRTIFLGNWIAGFKGPKLMVQIFTSFYRAFSR